MNIIQWLHTNQVFAGTTLRDNKQPDYNNMALHTGSNPENIIYNRKQLSTYIGIHLNQWVFAQQTHSDHIYKVTQADLGKGSLRQEDAIANCDALYTKEKGIAIGVFHADCVPILLYDPIHAIICAIHSGWIGTTKELTRKMMEHLIQVEGIDPLHIKAYIGPSIAFDSFEVGEDVVEKVNHMSFDTSKFVAAGKQGKAYVDTKGLNVQMLENTGVLRDNISVNRTDTYIKNEALFSYRRMPTCGRHVSFILLK